MQKVEIAICGAGPVGQTLALLLIKNGVKPENIALIDAKTQEQASKDKRTIALSSGSRQILDAAGAWPIKATEIHQIHVSRRGHFGRTLIDCAEHQVPALGYVARYGDIINPLADALAKHPSLCLIRPATVSIIQQTDMAAQILLTDHTIVEARLVVQAEGALSSLIESPSSVSSSASLSPPRHRDYRQTALIAHVKTSKPPPNRAYERFTDQGPLALLPQEEGYALVWCSRPDKATHLMALDETRFLAELQNAFGERAGRFISCTPRATFPLELHAQTNPPDERCIRIGNAAQTLHPVAGQGLNLGLRDAFMLARFLSKSMEPDSLQAFFRDRQTDRKTTIHLTDQLAHIFTVSQDGSIGQTLLGASLGFVDLFAPAQRWLAEQMMFGHR